MKKLEMDIIRTRRDAAQTAVKIHHERAVDDMRFVTGDHWPEEVRAQREADGQPCLTINTAPQSVRAVTGQIRALNPAIRVAAGDDEASKDTAEIIEGLIRRIENRSDASSIYEAAAESAAACSFGFWRVRTEYADGKSFNQEILIDRIYNPFSVFFDPAARHPTRSDAQWCFVVDEVPLETFKADYPDADLTPFTSDHKPSWVVQWSNAETVTVAEYFYIEYDEYEIGMAADGSIVKHPKPPINFTKKRKVREPKVMWAKVNGNEILEGPQEFPSRYMPIIAVTGEEWHVGEEIYISSVFRFAKDSALLYNYAASTAAEVTALQPKSPYLVTPKQIAGHEEKWGAANQTNTPYLPYTPDQNAPPPQRIQPAMGSQGLDRMMQVAAEDQKRTTGIYDAALGARSNETSGKAILARKEESQNSTSVYADNMVKAVMQTGKVILDMIPRVYDAKRTIVILGEDGQEKIEEINGLMMDQGGIVPINDVTVGRYDVRIQVGPSYQTKRQEGQEGMLAFMSAVPQAAEAAGDIFAGMQDWPESDRVQERLKKMLPAGLEVPDPDEMTPEEQQAAQQQAMQAQQQAQQQQEALALAKRGEEAKIAKLEAEAAKAAAEAKKAEFELSTLNGDLHAMVQQAVVQALHSVSGNQPI